MGEKREIECIANKKATPGLSSFEKTPELVGSYLQPLFDHATTVIPQEFHSETLIYLQATAGMRLVPEVSEGPHTVTYMIQVYDNVLEGCIMAQMVYGFIIPCGI